MMMSKRFNLAGQIPLITLVALCAVTALLTDRFLSPLNLTNILVQSSIMAVIAIGMTFVIIGGGFDLSVGSTVALAGSIAAMTMVKFGITAGVLAGIATGATVEPTERSKPPPMMTKVMPMAITAMIEDCTRMLVRFSGDKKRLVKSAVTMHSTTSVISGIWPTRLKRLPIVIRRWRRAAAVHRNLPHDRAAP